MYDAAIIWDWIGFAVRWLHVITGIAWIGSSFYFIALDLGLRADRPLPKGVKGEEWQVHGGGFYHIRKYMVAPDEMPDHLTWFKWEAYSTWLSGFALMIVVYYVNAELYLVESDEFSALHGIAISLASIGLGWVIYDWLCKSWFAKDATLLMILLYCVLVAMAWGYTQVFTGRAALLHLGAFTATIMSANVFFIIIPNQKLVVADLKAGREPDPKYGEIAKLRSTHNNYLTLPVLFLMLSNHYPLAFASAYNWVIASLVFLMGVTIRHYFNTLHARGEGQRWTWIATVLIFIAIMWLSSLGPKTPGEAVLTERQAAFVASPHYAEVENIVIGRCSMCHGAEPVWSGIRWAPKGVMLENEMEIATRAREIYLQAGLSHAMPPGNLTGITDDERAAIVIWYQDVSRSR